MTRRQRQMRDRTELTIYHLLQLACGHDFFGLAFGEGAEALDAMRIAWQDESVRSALYQWLADRNDDRVPFIENICSGESD